jgi:hypothetical protein
VLRRVPLALAAILLPLALGACGSTVATDSFKGESHAVAQRISAFQSDATEANEGKLCDNDLARAVKARLQRAGSSCRTALGRQLGQIDTVELKIEAVAVHGAGASARVKSTWSGRSRVTTMQLVKEGGAWKVAALL